MALSILRLLPPRVGQITHGSILYDGTDILHASPKEMLGLRGERISMIFQDPMTSLNPVSTVGDQILAVFDPTLFKCTSTKVYDVKSISYDYKPI